VRLLHRVWLLHCLLLLLLLLLLHCQLFVRLRLVQPWRLVLVLDQDLWLHLRLGLDQQRVLLPSHTSRCHCCCCPATSWHCLHDVRCRRNHCISVVTCRVVSLWMVG
jgi:hypothetical protein